MKIKIQQVYNISMNMLLIILLTACRTTKQVSNETKNISEIETLSENTDTETGSSISQENREQLSHDSFNDSGMKNRIQGGNDGHEGNARTIAKENDPEIQEVLDANANKFEQFTFEDTETGIVLEYSLYVPKDYDSSSQYPIIMFIPDATGSGKSAKQIVEQYYGATVWTTDEDQQKHPSFVLVPAFTETVVDDNWNVSAQIRTVVNLISELQSTYSIDSNRIYTTGQSMGCMTSFYLNSMYPNLFAASMYVSGQWDISVLKELENQKFFYITAGGDAKASGGQNDVMAMFDSDGISYSYGVWNAQNSEEDQSNAVEQLLSLGFDANIIRFETGTVFRDGESGMEHMASFNYGYRLTSVRDWLFKQIK